MAELGAHASEFASFWFARFFVGVLPSGHVLRVFDLVAVEGWKIIVRVRGERAASERRRGRALTPSPLSPLAQVGLALAQRLAPHAMRALTRAELCRIMVDPDLVRKTMPTPQSMLKVALRLNVSRGVDGSADGGRAGGRWGRRADGQTGERATGR